MSSLPNNLTTHPFGFFTTYGRTALLAALQAASVEQKEVLLPAFTCKNTVVDAVLQAGGIPVFVEVDHPTLNLNLDDLARKRTTRSRCVISHHYYGFASTNVGAIGEFCRNHGLIHVEDCAHSPGASYRGVPVGSTGDMSVFSFSKTMLNPGGGFVATSSQSLADRLHALCSRGSSLDTLYKNYYGIRLFSELYRDIVGRTHWIRYPVLGAQVGLAVLRTATRYDVARARGKFYQLSESDLGRNFPPVSLGMTSLQRRWIERSIRAEPDRRQRRKDRFFQLAEAMPNFFSTQEVDPVYSTFVFETGNKASILREAERRGIRLREPWPAFQPYWREQFTPTVQRLRNRLLIILLEETFRFSSAERFVSLLHEHRGS